MFKIPVFSVLVFLVGVANAQLAEVEYNYNNIGDCIVGAHNYTKTPLYLNLVFTSLENTTFREKLPYVKKLEPGFNAMFTLPREREEAPRFIFDIKTYRSNPLPEINLNFPYLIPFQPGTTVQPVDVKSMDGFWGPDIPKNWRATGFKAQPGEGVFAARQGQIVEISGPRKSDDTQTWYNTQVNAITLLQPDGTLITYKNVIDNEKQLKLNQLIQSGEKLGEVMPGASEIVVVVYYYSLYADGLQFVIPQFLTSPGKTEIVNQAQTIQVVHPDEVRGLEMTKKEQRQYLKTK
jgi:hypothetical protein